MTSNESSISPRQRIEQGSVNLTPAGISAIPAKGGPGRIFLNLGRIFVGVMHMGVF